MYFEPDHVTSVWVMTLYFYFRNYIRDGKLSKNRRRLSRLISHWPTIAKINCEFFLKEPSKACFTLSILNPTIWQAILYDQIKCTLAQRSFNSYLLYFDQTYIILILWSIEALILIKRWYVYDHNDTYQPFDLYDPLFYLFLLFWF